MFYVPHSKWCSGLVFRVCVSAFTPDLQVNTYALFSLDFLLKQVTKSQGIAAEA